jgi:hypothetical protein
MAYPDPDDPMFAAQLYQKREFYEARATVAGVAEGTIDPCTSAAAEAVFELTPVQRIVSRFLHPLTPYMGLLLYHGVGVGKTCSAVTIAEQFLETSANQVIVLVPQALKENFKRTVFDTSKLVWDSAEKTWTTRQCTGTAYLERLGLLENPDPRVVTFKIEESKRARYNVIGYQAFANWIEKTLAKRIPAGLTDPVARQAAENELLRRLFSDHLIIVDEAHNLRDLAAGPSDAVATGEAAENQGGKALNPFLRRIVLNAEGLRLVLMTATPMYNSAPEIVLLLNYLLMNDSKSESSALRIADLFTKDGELVAGPPQMRLEAAARRYVSYMRGENPYTFPLRMHPGPGPGPGPASSASSLWPSISATKRPMVLTETDAAALNALPLVFTEPVAGSPVERQLRAATGRGLVAVATATAAATAEEETSDAMLDTRMQMANLSYPNDMYGITGFDTHFAKQTVSGGGHKLRVFAPKEVAIDTVFAGEGLRTCAPKIHRIVESAKAARGICFIYSRYIKAGALPTAIALERAGFQRRLADGKIAPILQGVPPIAPICAICGTAHQGDDSQHPFHPACYILLTSEDDLSPNFAGLIRQATTWTDPDYGPLGSNVKVIIGSQVASEGLDLKCIREMHILDSWYHLNRTDQIIGRAIRYCSHTALRAVEQREGLPPMSLNNCLIYLHVLRIPETEAGPALETADMYAYRVAITKAQMVGKVQRILKRNAWDCNLELDAIRFTGLPPRSQTDAQGRLLESYSINDQDYTTYCDYQVCAHECAVTVTDPVLDESTFSFADARRLIVAKQEKVRRLFDEQIMVPESVVQEIFSDLPWEIASEAMMELIDGRKFRLTRPDGVAGYLVPKAGYLVFQPSKVTDTDIPMALRYARAFQMRRHFMEPRMPVWGRAEEAGPAGPTGPGPASNDVPERWPEWVAFVEGKGELPKGIPPLWKWLLERYASVPETRTVALQWWLEKIASYGQRKALIESAIRSPDENPVYRSMKRNIAKSESSVTYRIFSPEKDTVEFFWLKRDSTTFAPCPSTYAAIVDTSLGNKQVQIPEETGSMIGFLMPKEGKLIFKTVDSATFTQKKGAKKAPGGQRSQGAECGNTSNMQDHQRKAHTLHVAGLASDLAPFMLPDAEGAENKERSDRPEHLKDMKHASLCLYLEFLTRLFDARRVGGRRWFLNAIEAAQTNMMVKQ